MEKIIQRISLDLGFNRNSLNHTANKDKPLLAQGLTVPFAEGNPIALSRNLHPESELLVTIYDLGPKGNPPVTEMSLQIRFQNALEQPTSLPSKSTFTIFPSQDSPGHSTVFDQKGSAWNTYQVANSSCYPQNQLQRDKSMPPPDEGCLTFGQPGAFYFTIYLNVRWEDGVKKTFRVDPEIILSNNGPTPPDDVHSGDVKRAANR